MVFRGGESSVVFSGGKLSSVVFSWGDQYGFSVGVSVVFIYPN